MEKVKIKAFICTQRACNGSFPYSAWPINMSPAGYIFVCEVDVEFTPPANFDPIGAEVTRLQAEIKKTEDEAIAQVNYLRAQISNLLCITMEAPDERSAG